VRAALARFAGRTLHALPQIGYAAAYAFVDAFIRKLFWRMGDMAPVVYSIAPGVEMNLNLAEKTQRLIYLGQPYESSLTHLVESYLKSGNTFFDIGAHQGYYTLLAASLVGRQGTVVSFEPEARNFERLKANIARNGFTGRVIANKKAVSETSGETTLHLNPLNDGGASIHSFSEYHDSGTSWSEEAIKRTFGNVQLIEEVEMTSIDDWMRTEKMKLQPKLVKIDVEGNELPALAGMEELIQRARPSFIVEISDFSEAHRTFLNEHRYQIARISNRGIPHFLDQPETLPRGNYLLAPVG
jgi:FkbM family methyltransferase